MTTEKTISGKTWIFGDNVDTDQIIPAEFLVTGDSVELGRHAFEYARTGFKEKVQKGDIIVAGENFGCGSSREHAPRALLGAGISAVIAKSFARIFFRNSINIGLPLVECDLDLGEEDNIEVDFSAGTIKNLSSGKKHKFLPQPEFLIKIMGEGGLVAYTKNKLKGGG
ncbi:MAG: 3-isopropylmalate dehydratase small subunit [Candidatus Altiarchaeota archaeon]